MDFFSNILLSSNIFLLLFLLLFRNLLVFKYFDKVAIGGDLNEKGLLRRGMFFVHAIFMLIIIGIGIEILNIWFIFSFLIALIPMSLVNREDIVKLNLGAMTRSFSIIPFFTIEWRDKNCKIALIDRLMWIVFFVLLILWLLI